MPAKKGARSKCRLHKSTHKHVRKTKRTIKGGKGGNTIIIEGIERTVPIETAPIRPVKSVESVEHEKPPVYAVVQKNRDVVPELPGSKIQEMSQKVAANAARAAEIATTKFTGLSRSSSVNSGLGGSRPVSPLGPGKNNNPYALPQNAISPTNLAKPNFNTYSTPQNKTYSNIGNNGYAIVRRDGPIKLSNPPINVSVV